MSSIINQALVANLPSFYTYIVIEFVFIHKVSHKALQLIIRMLIVFKLAYNTSNTG